LTEVFWKVILIKVIGKLNLKYSHIFFVLLIS